MAPRDLQATVEDHYSDDDRPAPPPPEALRKSPTANVAAKRSHHSDLGGEKPVSEPAVNIDLRSDSGYSTHTTATMSSSADSATSAKASSPPTAPSSAASYPASSPPISRRRPTLDDDRKPSVQGSPRKPLQRTSSSASKRPGSTRRSSSTEECRDPNCTKCGPNAVPAPARTRKIVREPPRLAPVESGVDISFDQRSQRSDPAPASSYTSPPSPRFTRQPAPYGLGSAVVQPAQTRRRSSSTTRPRPMSYHEGQQYYANGMSVPYHSPPEHGPPPAMSAHFNMQQHQHMQYAQMNAYPAGMMPNGGYYQPALTMGQTSPPYDQPRPAISARGSSNATFSTRQPSRMGPTITYGRDDQPMPSARFPNAPQSARQERFPDAQEFDSESEEDDGSQYDEDEEEEDEGPLQARYEHALVPHRKLKSRRENESRPPLRKAKTTQVYNERRKSSMGMSQSSTLPERPRERDSRALRASTAASSRAQSKVRPALVQQPKPRPALVQQPKAQSAYETSRAGRVVVEDSRSRRSRSYQAYDDYTEDYDRDHLAEQKRRNRVSRLYNDDRNRGSKLYNDDRDRASKLYIDDREYRASREDAIVVPERRRRDTATSVGRRNSEYIVQDKPSQMAMDAEAYQQRSRGTNDPLADTVHKAAKRASRIPSNPSETGSNKSDDRKTRISQSARTTVTSGGANGEIRLRVDASAPLSLQFNGDMEGRTLQINPAEDGMADIVIGSSRGEESVYRSEQGSRIEGSRIGNRQSVVAGSTRRQFEEQSVRSSRSSQVRRDRELERRPLRRRQTEYN